MPRIVTAKGAGGKKRGLHEFVAGYLCVPSDIERKPDAWYAVRRWSRIDVGDIGRGF